MSTDEELLLTLRGSVRSGFPPHSLANGSTALTAGGKRFSGFFFWEAEGSPVEGLDFLKGSLLTFDTSSGRVGWASSWKITDRKLLLRAARTQRCAGEGELVFGLTKHAATLSTGGRGVKRCSLPFFGWSWPTVPDGSWCAEAKRRKGGVRGAGGLLPSGGKWPSRGRLRPSPKVPRVAWLSRSGRFRSQASGPHRYTVRRCMAPAPLADGGGAADRARRRGGGGTSRRPGGRQ